MFLLLFLLLTPSCSRRCQGPALVPGTPLPERGTCKHYKRSFRWLRFPCCGMLFPCDSCHDASAGHPSEWATRMVCGLCSREQTFTKDACKFCHGTATGAASSRYWEGGKGTRDQTKLARGDSRKHRGAGKTTSNKSKRVGPKAARKATRK